MTTPVITIFVRHSAGCRYAGDEFAKRCDCKKHLRWFANGTQHRRATGARTWADAESAKRALEDELSGRKPAEEVAAVTYLRDAIALFIKDRRVQGVSEETLGKYQLNLSRLAAYCEGRNVYTVQSVTRELLTDYCDTWPKVYPSTATRALVRQQCRTFLTFCFETRYIDRVPAMPKIRVESPETQPLTPEQYDAVLASINTVSPVRWDGKAGKGTSAKTRDRLRALIQLMRWSGLAIRDAATFHKRSLLCEGADVFRVVTSRTKTGTPVSVRIPPDVAKEILALEGDHPFWSGRGRPQSVANVWTTRYITPLFDAASVPNDGHMVAHRLRDTFAVDLLEHGASMEEVSRLLGHKSIKVTEKHYAKWSRGRQVNADARVMGTWKRRAA